MKILVIPGSYKNTMKSYSATGIIADAVQYAMPEADVQRFVIADGGEGTLEVFQTHFNSNNENHFIQNPLGKQVLAQIGFIDDQTAVIETSQAVGFSLLAPDEFNPFIASSYGVGELISIAIKKGIKKILVTMGDSSTMDMGIGMLNALGVKFITADGNSIIPKLEDLPRIVEIDDTAIRTIRDQIEFLGLVDTNDYLCGEIGQVQLYGKQKGLMASDIPIVESSYLHFSAIIQRMFGIDVTKLAGATGSGGIGAALHAFLDAKIINTLDYLSEKTNILTNINNADIVITGEGCLDNQTKFGKVPFFVASNCNSMCVGIFGRYTDEGFTDIKNVCSNFLAFTLNPETAIKEPGDSLYRSTHSIFSFYFKNS